jgi:hypothetical protein
MSLLFALARSPRAGAATVLRDGRVLGATVLVAVATAISTLHAIRFASEVAVEDVVFGPGRSPLITTLLSTIGRDLTSVVVYVIERAWDTLLVVTALSPLLIWVLGATAIHAAARLAGSRRPFQPILVLVGYATGSTRPLADLAGLIFGSRGPGAALAQLIGTVALVWLGVLLWNGIAAHYAVTGGRALTILVVALLLFYLAPLTLILVALLAVLATAIVLEYFPAR